MIHRLLSAALLLASPLTACAQETSEPPLTAEQKAEKDLFDLASDIYQAEQEAAELQDDVQSFMDSMDLLKLDPEVMDRAMRTSTEQAATEQADEADRTPSFLDTPIGLSALADTADWSTDVLIKGEQDRMLRRDAVIKALTAEDGEAFQTAVAVLDQWEDPYRHLARALASFEGVGLPQNDPAGFEYARQAAKEGVVESYALLNAAHLSGRGTEADMDAAYLWHVRMAQAHQPRAYRTLGDALVKGTYGPRDPRFVLHVLDHSENHGVPDSDVERARLLMYGKDIPRDLPKAHDLLSAHADDSWNTGARDRARILLEEPAFEAAGLTRPDYADD